MDKEYDIRGLFYENNGYLCRKYLNIRRKSLNVVEPDLMIVMMNPGSSFPKDENDNNVVESGAALDDTQRQIIRVMNNCNFNYARILNLSDFRESKSDVFYSEIDNLKNISHSIFSDRRTEDFENLFVKDIPVVVAWGVSKKLEKLAENAIGKINKKNIYGLLKRGTKVLYYHPLPPNFNKQKKWVSEITIMLGRVKTTEPQPPLLGELSDH